ncbi:TPA: arylamine N-acetyltransferase [Bacillus cereus]|nr:arylamine N-acetyltransferase [Bacillus cereus]
MTDLQNAFCLRLGLSNTKHVVFEDLHEILLKMGTIIPYENIDIVNKKIKEVSRVSIQDKLLIRKRGGMCYELNLLLYYFLADSGFDVYMGKGTLYDSEAREWEPYDTHTFIILKYQNKKYIIDNGLAARNPLYPIPLNEDIISSQTGNYRIGKQDTEKGDYILEMNKENKVKKKGSWEAIYAFSLDKINEQTIQHLVLEYQEIFSKKQMIFKLTDDGYITLTQQNITRTKYGTKTKKAINKEMFNQILVDVFGISQENR